MTHISPDVQRITLNASSCMMISGGRTEQLDIIGGFLPRHWLYEWFSQFHSCRTYSVLSRSPPISGSSLQGLLLGDNHPPTFSSGVRWSCTLIPCTTATISSSVILDFSRALKQFCLYTQQYIQVPAELILGSHQSSSHLISHEFFYKFEINFLNWN